MEFDPLNASASKLTSLLYELVALPIVKLEEPKRLYFQLGGSNNAARTLFLHLQEHVFIVCYMGDLQSPKSEPYPMNAKIIYQRVLDPIFESGVHKLACCVYMAKVVNEFKARYAAADGYTPGDTSMLVIPTIHVISAKLLQTALKFYSGYNVGTRGNNHFILNDTMHVILDCESLSYYTNPLEPVSVTYPHFMQLNLESMRVSSELEYGSRATDAFIAFLLNFVRSQQQVMNSEPQVCPPPVQGVAVTLKASSEYSAFDVAKDSGNTREDALYTENAPPLSDSGLNTPQVHTNAPAADPNLLTLETAYVSPLVQATSPECDYPDTEALLIADDPVVHGGSNTGVHACTAKPTVTQVHASSYNAFEATGLSVGGAQMLRSTFRSMFGSRSALYASSADITAPMPLFFV